VSKGLIAERIGVTAATLSRAFRELSTAELILVRGRNITLREKLLARHHAACRSTAETKPVPTNERRRSDPWMIHLPEHDLHDSRAWL
jgi:hypothetical protein